MLERSAAGDGAARPVPDLAIIAGAALVGVALFAVVVRRRRRAAPDAGGDGAGEAAAADEPPEELLSDEERVLARLEERGGRMKQQDLVAEMGWSETKTSEVVGRLQDDDRIEVYRIGRENVLALPGEMDV